MKAGIHRQTSAARSSFPSNLTSRWSAKRCSGDHMSLRAETSVAVGTPVTASDAKLVHRASGHDQGTPTEECAMKLRINIAPLVLVGTVLVGCSANTAITVTHPPSTEAKTIKVTVSGRWPTDNPVSVRDHVCETLRAECRICPVPDLNQKKSTLSDILQAIDKLPVHSFSWSGTCEQAKADCCPPPSGI